MASDSRGIEFGEQLRQLERLCRTYDLVPTSSRIIQDIVLTSSVPISCSYLSDVFEGRLGTKAVAVKALRLHTDQVMKVKKVRSPHRVCRQEHLHDIGIYP
jgi:bifunctional pyridoxal-dependent enzyme with beta-cystathionase and maltose regulon repressor activities